MSDLKYWLGFNKVSGIGPAKMQALIAAFGTPEAAWFADDYSLRQMGLDKRARDNLRLGRETFDLDWELERLERANVRLLTWDSADYPECLKHIPASPPVIYVKGKLSTSDQRAVGLVGTRRVTAYGKQVTRDLSEQLVQNQVTIVSGLARGVDSIAHQVAVQNGGRTLAVLGSGLDSIYPPENRRLADAIADGRGAVISEYALGVKPEAKNFPPRNRIISALSLGIVVVEAGERSGALITARFALEQGREVYAVPGNLTSKNSIGTNRLIQEGARLVTSADDILNDLNLGRSVAQQAAQLVLPTSAEEAQLIQRLGDAPVHVDELTRLTGMPTQLVTSTLVMMELKGMVQSLGSMQYSAVGRRTAPRQSA